VDTAVAAVGGILSYQYVSETVDAMEIPRNSILASTLGDSS
jgi:hypothetical protein